MNKEMGFSKYGKQFQESLAQMILEDRPFADQIEEVIDTQFFELNYLRIFVKKIFNFTFCIRFSTVIEKKTSIWKYV